MKEIPSFNAQDISLNFRIENNEALAPFQTRLKRWQHRHLFYQDIPGYESFINWHNSSNFIKKRLKRIQAALIAYEALQTYHSNHEDRAMLEQEILAFIDIQIKRLEKKQETKQADIKDTETVALYFNDLETIKREEEWKKKIRKLKLANKSDLSAGNITTFFKEQSKRNITLKKAIKNSQKFSDGMLLAARTEHASANIHNVARFFFDTSRGLKDFFVSIPIISSIAFTIPMVLDIARTWSKNTPGGRVGAAALAAFFIGGIIAAGVATAAAAFIVVGLITVGSYFHTVKPFLQHLKKEKSRKKDLANTQKRAEAYATNFNKITVISNKEKYALLSQLEKYVVNKSEDLTDEITAAKKAISSGELAKIKACPIIEKSLGTNIHSFLKAFTKARVDFIKKDLNNLDELKKHKRRSVITSGISVLGAIMMCIPTPVTWAIGASLLAVGTLTDIAIRHQWGTKIKNLFGRLTGRKNKETNESHEDDPTLRAEKKPIHNVEADIFKRLHPDQPTEDAKRVLSHEDGAEKRKVLARAVQQPKPSNDPTIVDHDPDVEDSDKQESQNRPRRNR